MQKYNFCDKIEIISYYFYSFLLKLYFFYKNLEFYESGSNKKKLADPQSWIVLKNINDVFNMYNC